MLTSRYKSRLEHNLGRLRIVITTAHRDDAKGLQVSHLLDQYAPASSALHGRQTIQSTSRIHRTYFYISATLLIAHRKYPLAT